ncbi:hypothetical protein [Paenibacillus campi]|uniref:hypothetical protein n=1 Tax=Paenibacillus campi TaxID=3106031 RepID=UPI002AFE2564|nr:MULTISPECIES: hypothetical protein [unclassified Paenibacillus]
MTVVHVSPPWYTVWNQIYNTIGQDAAVKVEPLDTSHNPYVVEIAVEDASKGGALATIVVPSYSFGGVSVEVRVVDANGKQYAPAVGENVQGVAKLFQAALKDNPLFTGVEVRPYLPIQSSQVVFPIFEASVIQFYNDNLVDFYGNYNDTAAAVFHQILLNAVNGITVLASTKSNK